MHRRIALTALGAFGLTLAGGVVANANAASPVQTYVHQGPVVCYTRNTEMDICAPESAAAGATYNAQPLVGASVAANHVACVGISYQIPVCVRPIK